MTDSSIVKTVSATAIPVRGNDIDTDRIIPARFMKVVTFDGLGEYAFNDDRAQVKDAGSVHPFDQDRFAESAILLVNKNFGCGSSREHAPQSLHRWGIRACIGESFAEIFKGNCVGLGMPCLIADAGTMARLQGLAEEKPETEFVIDLDAEVVQADGHTWPIQIPAGEKQRLIGGTWDALGTLLGTLSNVEETLDKLPYITGFKA